MQTLIDKSKETGVFLTSQQAGQLLMDLYQAKKCIPSTGRLRTEVKNVVLPPVNGEVQADGNVLLAWGSSITMISKVAAETLEPFGHQGNDDEDQASRDAASQ